MSESRTKKGTRNVLFGIGASVIILLMSFLSRSIFIHYLSTEYLGLNGLFSNILDFLSLAELGVGNAINFALYKPLKDNDENKIKSLLALYKRFYVIIGLFILVVGLSLTPYLQFFIKEMPTNIPDIRLYYVLYVLNSGASYFFAYKKSLLICDQKEYIINISQIILKITTVGLQIIILMATHDYLYYLLVMVCCTILENIVVAIIVDAKYPYLRGGKIDDLSFSEQESINNNIIALIYHKIGGAVVFSSDNIIISKFVGLTSIGLYSNYTLIVSSVDTILKKIFSSLVASIGNLMASDNIEHIEIIFYRLLYVNAFVYGVASVCLYTLLNPFITIWIGSKYLMPNSVTTCMCISFYITGLRKTVLAFKDAGGIFQQDKFKSLVEAFVNIVFSIPLAIKWGVMGIILGTIGSTLFVSFWYEGYILYKEVFSKTPSKYFLKQLIYFIETIITAFVVSEICSMLPSNGVIWFIIKTVICLMITLLVFVVVKLRTDEFAYFKKLVSTFLANILKNKTNG